MMKTLNRAAIGLRGLMLTFVLLAVLATLVNCLIVAYGVQRDALVSSALDANRAYAFKTASSIDEFIHSVQGRLKYSSQSLGDDFDNRQLLKTEAKRLQAQDAELNAVVIVDAVGRALEAYPEMSDLVGTTLRSEEIQQALTERRPLVSQAYTAATGNLVVLIAQPVVSPAGKFLGVVAGLIYLQEHGVMQTLIGAHQLDGAFAFIVDEHRRFLYHPELERIGRLLSASAPVDAALGGSNGAMETINYQGIPMLSGYAQIAGAGWAVVAQQPRESALAPLKQLMREMLVKIVPPGVIGLLLILAGAMLISRPLRQLASSATQLSDPRTTQALQGINAWYAEAAAIRQALVASVQVVQQKIGSLNKAAESDPLTGLANRRAMNGALDALDRSPLPYAALALDIDYFKRVNDTFGHDAGDVALQQIAQIIQHCSRTGDLACRAGGEEFCLLLPETDLDEAHEIAERIRSTVASTHIAQVGALTISIGVALRGADTPTAESILKRADERLYLAKHAGRNRVVSVGAGLPREAT